MRDAVARPFLKWAGGKTQLLRQFEPLFPKELQQGRITRYYEPFLGGGAVFFHLAGRCDFQTAHLSDVNPTLIALYTLVRDKTEPLIAALASLRDAYLRKNEGGQRKFYYECRKEYNALPSGSTRLRDRLRKGALTIFLNKTCYNGLFRLNSQGGFNSPYGHHRNKRVYNEANLRAAGATLRNTKLVALDFRKTVALVADGNPRASFVYLDPPYRPLSATAGFTAYSSGAFSEKDQRDLAAVFRTLDASGAKVMLSNSDPKNENPSDHFFEDLYSGFTFRRVAARRMINSNAGKRGAIKELVITNYEVPK
ncbi:MAG: DNA adenine methylase [Fibrobacterota bacterium]